jgi:hypothetical protein
MESPKQSDLLTAGGRIRCARCQAKSKRHGGQCGAPAERGRAVCRFHGGKSTGPKTEAGRQRCAEAKTIHGRETQAKRMQASELSALLRAYAAILGVPYWSKRIRTARPKKPRPK